VEWRKTKYIHTPHPPPQTSTNPLPYLPPNLTRGTHRIGHTIASLQWECIRKDEISTMCLQLKTNTSPHLAGTSTASLLQFKHEEAALVVIKVCVASKILPKMNNQLITCEESFVALFTPVTLMRRGYLLAVPPSRVFGQILLRHKRCSTFSTHASFVCSTDMCLHMINQFRLSVERLIATVKVTQKLVACVFSLNLILLKVTSMLVSPQVTFKKHCNKLTNRQTYRYNDNIYCACG